ncbi:MAG: thiamine pyrophosphate-binding protein [Candidatus Rokuibacteriota bacterium]|nr:MAG: thiamine pyrophosphate-binding protein [Candidatus Rokubacteria bacterium]
MSLDKPEYVSDLVVYLLNRLGVEYVTLNPGATTRGMHESLVTYGGNIAPEVITCSHEEVAVAMAEGYYLATGRPQATLVHNIVGLQHASKAIYEAWLNNAPMIIIGGTGPMDATHRRPWIDWIHTAQVQAQIVRDYVKWDDQPQGALSVAESILRAYQIAMTEPRGPVYLCLDVELQESRLPDGFVIPDPSRYRPAAPPSGNSEAMADAAKALCEARWPVLLVEGLGRAPGGPAALQSLSELLGIPVIEVGSSFNLSNLHHLNVSGASADVLKDADLVLTVGVKDVEAALTRPEPEGIVPAGLPRVASGFSRRHQSVIRDGTRLVRVGLQEYGVRAWTSSHGRLTPADISILGSGPQVLRELTRLCQSAMDGDLQRRVAERAARTREIHTAIVARAQKDLKERWWAQTPIATARLAAEIWETIRDQDWVLAHGSLSGWERRLWEVSDGARFIAGGGGTGTGMGVAMGVALAFRGTGKVCISIQNDGDLLYTPGSLWTAAHHGVPMLIVMFNNRSYYQDVGHQLAITRMRQRALDNVGVGVSLEGPATDFATLAKSFAIYGEGPILNPEEIRPALERGLRVVKEKGAPALIDTITQPR